MKIYVIVKSYRSEMFGSVVIDLLESYENKKDAEQEISYLEKIEDLCTISYTIQELEYYPK